MIIYPFTTLHNNCRQLYANLILFKHVELWLKYDKQIQQSWLLKARENRKNQNRFRKSYFREILSLEYNVSFNYETEIEGKLRENVTECVQQFKSIQ